MPKTNTIIEIPVTGGPSLFLDKVTNELTIPVSMALAECEIRIAALKKFQDTYKAAIMKAMIDNDIKRYEDKHITITFVEEAETSKLDTDALKKERPEVVAMYTKPSKNSAYVKIKAKPVEFAAAGSVEVKIPNKPE